MLANLGYGSKELGLYSSWGSVKMTCQPLSITLVYYLLYITIVCPTLHSSPQVNNITSSLTFSTGYEPGSVSTVTATISKLQKFDPPSSLSNPMTGLRVLQSSHAGLYMESSIQDPTYGPLQSPHAGPHIESFMQDPVSLSHTSNCDSRFRNSILYFKLR